MRSKFPGYCRKHPEDINKLLADCLFVFDANVLFNLYRYSPSTSSDLRKVIDGVKERVWLPHQAAFEFLRGRHRVIATQHKAYTDMGGKLVQLLKEVDQPRTHPILSENGIGTLRETVRLVGAEVKTLGDGYQKRIHGYDDILNWVLETFEGKTGDGYTAQELDNIYKEGENRYKQLIPPGFKDAAKADKTDKDDVQVVRREYGDLVLWLQVIAHAATTKRNIILITDDRKQDWWWLQDQYTIGPRPELVEEIETKAQCQFHMYQPQAFIKHVAASAGVKLQAASVSEAEQASSKSKERNRYEDTFANLRTFKEEVAIQKVKIIIQEQYGFTEPQAYKWLQRKAMRNRISLARFAAIFLDAQT